MRSVRSLSEGVRSLILRAGICEETAGELELCVAECANNIIEHGYALDPGHRVRLDVLIGRQEIRLEIRDWAEPFDLRSLPPPLEPDPARLDLLPERGMGAGVIRGLTTHFEYQVTDDGNCTTLIRTIKPEDRDLR